MDYHHRHFFNLQDLEIIYKVFEVFISFFSLHKNEVLSIHDQKLEHYFILMSQFFINHT
jgi:hypothetical protein